MQAASCRPPRFLLVLCAGALLAPAGCTAQTAPAEKTGPPNAAVTLERVKHSQLQERLAALRGKIVVLDFWGEF